MLQGNYSGSAADFSALARLMHTDLLEQPKALPNVVCEDTEWKVPENLF